MRRALLLVGIILILSTVVLVVELVGVLTSLALQLLAVVEVLALGLGEPVDLGAGEASEELLGELVAHGLACRVVLVVRSVRELWMVLWLTLLALVVLEGLERGERSSTGEQLMAELGLVLTALLVTLVLVVDLVVVLLGIA